MVYFKCMVHLYPFICNKEKKIFIQIFLRNSVERKSIFQTGVNFRAKRTDEKPEKGEEDQEERAIVVVTKFPGITHKLIVSHKTIIIAF